MESNPFDTASVPFDITGPVDPTLQPYDAGTGTPTIGNPGNTTPLPSPGYPKIGPGPGSDPLQGFFNDVVNAPDAIFAMLGIVGKTLGQLGLAITDEVAAPIGAILNGIGSYAGHIGFALDHNQLLTWKTLANLSPSSVLFKEMLRDGLGLHPDDWDSEAKSGIDTVDRMLTFAAMMPLISAFIAMCGKIPLAGRWAEVIGEVFAKIPEEMGVSWAMGLTIDEAFKTAVGRSIEEEINKEKRPNRIEWPILRQMLRQHTLDKYTVNSDGNIVAASGDGSTQNGIDVLRELLKRNGFPDDQIDWIITLADVNIPVGDIQQLYLYDIYSESDAMDAITKLGFSPEDANNLFQLYISKAETAAGSVLRSTARELYRNYLIDDARYRSILKEANFPAKEIDKDIEAISLEHEVGRVNATSSVIKSKYLHNQIDSNQAQQMLRVDGLSPDAAAAMVASWAALPIHPKHGLSQAKILSYLISGVLTPDQAGPMLLDTGLTPDATAILLAHPSAHPAVTMHQLSPGFVVTAYLDGAIDETSLQPTLARAGVKPEDMNYWVTVAHYRYTHRKTPSGPTQPLTKGEIIDAFKYGIYDMNQALQQLMALNYSSDNAMILLEIANKGKFVPPSAPYFTSVEGAIIYLQEEGFTVFAPTDPKTIAAENMVAQAGYSYSAPNAPPTPLPEPHPI